MTQVIAVGARMVEDAYRQENVTAIGVFMVHTVICHVLSIPTEETVVKPVIAAKVQYALQMLVAVDAGMEWGRCLGQVL